MTPNEATFRQTLDPHAETAVMNWDIAVPKSFRSIEDLIFPGETTTWKPERPASSGAKPRARPQEKRPTTRSWPPTWRALRSTT